MNWRSGGHRRGLSGNRAARLAEVRRLTGIRSLAELPKPQVERCGTVERAGFRIEKLAIVPEKGIVLPALLFLPEKPKPGPVVLYLHDQGKSADAGPGGPIEQRVRAGETVLAVDLRGLGQLAPPRTTITIATVGKTYTRPICWADPTLGCGPKTSSFALVTRRSDWRIIGMAPYRWWPSATSASPPSTPPPWSQRCFRT